MRFRPRAACLLGLIAWIAPAVGLRAQDGSAPTIAKFEFAGTTLGGRAVAQDAYAQHVLIVDLWGTWCPPCRKAVPVLVKLYEKYKQHGLEIVGLCYESNGEPEDADKVRKFAAAQRITYDLLPGSAAMRKQVPGFRGYPTMLMFEKGLKHVKTHVGFGDELEAELETWIRGALGLDQPAGGDKDGKAGEGKAGEKEKPEPPEEVPAGKLFQPGNGDRGWELAIDDLDGKRIDFTSLGDTPVLLAITTSWDQEAARTAKLLAALRKDRPGLRVIAWHLEKDRDPDKKAEAARAFLKAQSADYEAFVTELTVAREKVHRFASLPTFLLFDAKGVLVLREGGISDAIERRVRERARQLLEQPAR